jgi:threonine/homoserine/homoserine lactone efflux protein
MTANVLLPYMLVVLGLFLIPGPAVLLILARGASGGRAVGLATAAGIAAGDAVHTLMATFGLSAVLMTSALAFSVLKYAGAAYLVYLGIRALMERGVDIGLPLTHALPPAAAFRQAVFAELLNPKTALFFLAFLPQFVHPERGMAVLQFATLGTLFVVMSLLYSSLVALAAGRVGSWLGRHRRIGRWQGKFVGVVYLGLGLRLAAEHR